MNSGSLHGRSERKVTRLRVLVVEDHPDSALGLQKVLESRGYDARTAGSYRQALALASQWVPDFVVGDIVMPGKDGFEMIKTMRQAYPDLKAIAVSGRVSAEMAESARQAGYAEFLAKPIDPDRLLSAMDRVLGTA